MIITWQTSLIHNVAVNIENAENMDQDELRKAILEEDSDFVYIESPCEREIFKAAWSDLQDEVELNPTGIEPNKEERKALETGETIRHLYS